MSSRFESFLKMHNNTAAEENVRELNGETVCIDACYFRIKKIMSHPGLCSSIDLLMYLSRILQTECIITKGGCKSL